MTVSTAFHTWSDEDGSGHHVRFPLMTRATLIRAVIAPRWLPLSSAVALMAVAAAVHMAIPWFLARIIDEGLLQRDAGAVIRWGAALTAVSLVNPVAYVPGFRLLALAEADARRDVNLRVNNRSARGGCTASGRTWVRRSTSSRGITRRWRRSFLPWVTAR